MRAAVRRTSGLRRDGFSLVELMIVVAILGILAAVAIPSFIGYVRRAKSIEATETLRALFVSAATYHQRERFGVGLDASATQVRDCTVASADNKLVPGPDKRAGTYTDPGFVALAFQHAPSYFHYAIVNGFAPTGACNVPASTGIYTLRARGDLDGDTHTSLFELAVGTDADSALFHAQSFHLVDELE